MSTREQLTPTIPTSAVRNTGGRSDPQGLEEPTPDEVVREMCDKNYHQLLPLIAEKCKKKKEQQDKLNAVKARLLYSDESKRNPRNHEESHYCESKRPTARIEPRRRHGSKHSRSPLPIASVFRRLKPRSASPRHRPQREGVYSRDWEDEIRACPNDLTAATKAPAQGKLEIPQKGTTAILASSSEVPSVLEFLQRRKLEAKKVSQEVAASEFSHLNHSLSHRPVSVKPDISKASFVGGKLHILKPSCERNGITPTPGKLEDVRSDPDLGIGGLQIQAPSLMISSLRSNSSGKSTRIMNPQETQQVTARDEKWVPFTDRVKVSSTNVRLETTVQQKEETFQVVIDLVKNSSCFKAFTIPADVLEIFMQQFWKILDICPRVEGVNFTNVPDDDTTLAFLIKLGYKGPQYKHTNMFVDHMHQPWRTLAAIINKCLSRKTTSNDKLCKSRIDILWGMFYRDNVDYPELDLASQIDHRKEKRSRHENMPFPRLTKVIINHFLKQHKSLSNLNFKHYHTIKDDGIVCRLKFVRIGEDYQEYGLPIPETMQTEEIKQFESYQMFIKYYSGQIPPQEKKRQRFIKKLTLSANDNIISDDPDTALELGKSISQTKAEEAQATKQVHATHARIVTESVPEPTKRTKSGKVTSDPPKKLKGVPSLTPEEQEAADIIEGTGTKPEVLEEEKEITEENVILEWGLLVQIL
ncbi:hypothetical protein Tco_1156876 [Tanacetum coccineum]